MDGYHEVLALLGCGAAVGKAVKTVADLGAAVGVGLPRAALDHVVECLRSVARAEPARSRSACGRESD
jgi:hypothetical protein